MRILFVDNVDHQYSIDNITIQTVGSKEEAFEIIEASKCDMIFVNVKFNHDFVFKIRKANPAIPVFLINDNDDIKGLAEYAGLIDGYYNKPIQNQLLTKIVNKPMYSKRMKIGG